MYLDVKRTIYTSVFKISVLLCVEIHRKCGNYWIALTPFFQSNKQSTQYWTQWHCDSMSVHKQYRCKQFFLSLKLSEMFSLWTNIFLCRTPRTGIIILRHVLVDKGVFDFYRYRDNTKKMSAIPKDEPESSLNWAVWWTEYVMRHNGAKHLRSAALDLAWYQYLSLDVAAFLFILLALTVLVSYLTLKIVYRYLTAQYYNVKWKRD
jgi:hypothetical protein